MSQKRQAVFLREEEFSRRKEKQMQGFRTYNVPDMMLLLHSGSIEKTECEKDVNALLDKKAS